MARMAKRSLVSLLIVPPLMAIGAVGVLWAADLCNSTRGVLEGTHLIQEEDVWCFVTSSAEVLRHLDVRDPATGSHYSPCRLYNIAKTSGTNCCAVSHPTGVQACKELGWPDEVFDVLIPNQYKSGGALGWSDIKGQICPAGNPGHPFIYVAHPQQGGIAHTYTVIGFNEDATLRQNILYVHSHETVGPGPMGSGFVDHACYFEGDCPNVPYTHDGDYYDFSLNSTTSPPSAPTNLIVR
jgi:hypothetical protein